MDVYGLEADFVNPNTFYTTSEKGIVKSTDGGVSWIPIYGKGGLLAVARSNPDFIYGYAWGDAGFQVSTDGGATWHTRNYPVPFENQSFFEIDPQNPNIIYTFLSDYDFLIDLYKSTDGGLSWTELRYPAGYHVYSTALKIDPASPNNVYAASFFGIYQSIDGGSTWTLRGTTCTINAPCDPPTALYLAADPFLAGTFYSARYNGNGYSIYRSTHELWFSLYDTGFSASVNGLAIDQAGRFVYAATSTGVYRVRLRQGSNVNPDFDGDGSADVSVFRPADGNWYLKGSNGGFSATQFGIATDRITPADFDGDGKTDIAVFRDGTWFWLGSLNGNFNAFHFGTTGDIPVPADYTGDGRAELGVYRSGIWHTLDLANDNFQSTQFGISTDKPVPADYDGDGQVDHAVYRDGTWYLLRSTLGSSAIQFGVSTDRPVPADYDADGRADPAVYRDGTWYMLGSHDGFKAIQFGVASDTPVPADYDGDGTTDPAVYRAGVWYSMRSTTGFSAINFGIASDVPVPSAFLR